MPSFEAFRKEYKSVDAQFGAEKAHYVVEVAPPQPYYTIKGDQWHEDTPPEPVVDKRPFDRAYQAEYHPDYPQTVLSDHLAARYEAKEGDWILIVLWNPIDSHQHSFYTRVSGITRRGEPHYNPLRFRLSGPEVEAEFSRREKVYIKRPPVLHLVKRPDGRGSCYIGG